MRPSIARTNEQLDPRQQLANTPPLQSTTPGLHAVSIHQMALPEQTSDCSFLLIYRPQKDERLSWPSWLTCRLKVYQHRWSPVRCRSSAGQGKFADQWPTFYHCATPPTNDCLSLPVMEGVLLLTHRLQISKILAWKTFGKKDLQTLELGQCGWEQNTCKTFLNPAR